MKYPITEYDKELLLQNILQYKIRVTVTDADKKIIDVLYGISDTGGIHIDADSDIRRTFSFSLLLDDFISGIEQKIAAWMGLYYEVDIGVRDNQNGEYVYYPNGRFCITQTSTAYDATTNSISFSLSDRICELDGTRNGQIGGAPTITIPKEADGKKQTIRGVVTNLLSSSTRIKNYFIDDIGEYKGMPQNNPDYESYRRLNDEWNILPYDLTYSSGAFMSDILFDIRDLYPNCQMYFDVYDNFCFDMIPSLDKDVPDLDSGYVEKLLTASGSESVSYDITAIKNVTEIFGKAYDVDRYAVSASYAGNIYALALDGYEHYVKYDMIAFTPPQDNQAAPKLKINALDALPVFFEYTQTPVTPGTLKAGTLCVIKIHRAESSYVAYYLGQYQPHTLCVLTNNALDPHYTKAYFAGKYNVEEKNILFREEPFCPFVIQRQGEICDTRSGDAFDNILSDSAALENARYYNRVSSTMFDTVTITTKLIPWLDVNVKVNYRKTQEDSVFSYVVKSRYDNFADGTSTITMYRFLQLYE